MFIDTHGHINTMLNNNIDMALTPDKLKEARHIIDEALAEHVNVIINVGTSLIESNNSVLLAQAYKQIFAVVGIHPNDCTAAWQNDFATIRTLVKHKEKNRIVGIGECGIDKHYPGYNLARQTDAFRAHIELALEHDLALVVHSRDAYDETLTILDRYAGDIKRGVMHCFSYDQAFADSVTAQDFMLGIGGTVSYPKNKTLHIIVKDIELKNLVLETDAPFLPPQQLRGHKNHPKNIPLIAKVIAELRSETIEHIAEQTTRNARRLFALDTYY
jgi:TatD DNase family protein